MAVLSRTSGSMCRVWRFGCKLGARTYSPHDVSMLSGMETSSIDCQLKRLPYGVSLLNRGAWLYLLLLLLLLGQWCLALSHNCMPFHSLGVHPCLPEGLTVAGALAAVGAREQWPLSGEPVRRPMT